MALSVIETGSELARAAPVTVATPGPPPIGQRGPRWRRAAATAVRRPGLVAAVILLGLVVLAAFAPHVLTSRDPLQAVPADKLQAPNAHHWFGTDQLGRDLYARVVHGASLTLRASVLAVGLSLVAGSALGLLSGFAGGSVDTALMRVVDVALSIPQLLLSLAVVTALGFGATNVAIAVGVAAMARFARVMRAEVLRIRTATYVEAARAAGVRARTVARRHVLPNAVGPVLGLAAIGFGTATLAISALSFLGYGEPPPTPEWGSLVAGGRSYLASAWWLTTLPGIVVAATVLASARVARALEPGRNGR